MSKYFQSLTGQARHRYLEKISIIGGHDPFEIAAKQWSDNPESFPPSTYFDIVNYLVYGSSPFYSISEFQNYKSLESYDRFVSGWVRKVQVHNYFCDNDGEVLKFFVVKAKVNHSQRLSESPVSCWIIFSENGQVVNAHCTCMAGLGESCSHVASTMFYIEAAVRLKEKKTVTQEAAYWLLPKAQANVEYARIKDINFSSSKSMKKNLDQMIDGCADNVHSPPNSSKQIYKASANQFKNFMSKIAKFKPAFHSVHPDYSADFKPKVLHEKYPVVLTELYDENLSCMTYECIKSNCATINFNVTQQQVDLLEKETRSQYKSARWYLFRSGRVTASKFKASVTTSLIQPSKSLIKNICYPNQYKFQSAATKWGIDHEDIGKQVFIDMESKKHSAFKVSDCGLFLSAKYPFIGATPDGIVNCDCCSSRCLEIKCPYSFRDKTFSNLPTAFCLKESGGKLQLNKNHSYYYQIQMQMAVTNCQSCDFVVWSTKDIHIENISFDQLFWETEIKRCEVFFNSVLLPELLSKYFSKMSSSATDQQSYSIQFDHSYTQKRSADEENPQSKKQKL